MLKITPQEMSLVSQYIKTISGIHLDNSKSYLIETRLSNIAQKNSCKSYRELHDKARKEPTKKLEREIIDAITTNETLFFRDKSPFALLQHKILPELIDNRSAKNRGRISLRIWSAAASTGQEIYSICIVLKELLQGNPQFRIELLGTDISDAALAQASYGKYNKFEIERGLDKRYLQKYFTLQGDAWKVSDELRAMAKFQKLNLMKPFNTLGTFDIIFCRNVAIYFTLEDRRQLFTKIANQLADDGYLIIGSTESLSGVAPHFVPKRHLKSIFYQKKR